MIDPPISWTDQDLCSDYRDIPWKQEFCTSDLSILGGVMLKGYGDMANEKTCGFCNFCMAARRAAYPDASFEEDDKFPRLAAVWPARVSATDYDSPEAKHYRILEGYSSSYRWRISAMAEGDIFKLVYPYPIDIVPLAENAPESNRYRSAVRIPAGGSIDRTLPKRWLDYCKSDHVGYKCGIGSYGLGCGGCRTWTQLTHCINTPFRFRVIDVAEFRVIDAPPDCHYVALSYVWGAANVHRSSKTDFKAQPDGSFSMDLRPFVDRIPQTILDAMEVVKMLEARYLWVDALCIAQDDEQELSETLPAMCLIYEAATVTIVAASGTDANAGLPGVRPNSRNTRQLSLQVRDVTLVHVAPRLLDAMAGSVWETRGWTYQEDRFSRRKIIFTERHMYWKCSYERIAEDAFYDKGDYLPRVLDPTRPPRTIPVHPFGEDVVGASLSSSSSHRVPLGDPPQGRPSDLKTFFHDYDLSVREFTARDLTSQADILRAFAGTVTAMGKSAGRIFVSGLPRNVFDAALLWKAAPQWELTAWDTSDEVEYYECEAVPISRVHQTADWKDQQLARSALRRREGFPSWAWCGWAGGSIGYDQVGNTVTMSAGGLVGVISDIVWPWEPDFQDSQGLGLTFEASHAQLLITGFIATVDLAALVSRGTSLGEKQQTDFWGWTTDVGELLAEGNLECLALSHTMSGLQYVMMLRRDGSDSRRCYRRGLATLGMEEWLLFGPVREQILLC